MTTYWRRLLSQELYVAGPGAQQGDRTARGLLLIWTFNDPVRCRAGCLGVPHVDLLDILADPAGWEVGSGGGPYGMRIGR